MPKDAHWVKTVLLLFLKEVISVEVMIVVGWSLMGSVARFRKTKQDILNFR